MGEHRFKIRQSNRTAVLGWVDKLATPVALGSFPAVSLQEAKAAATMVLADAERAAVNDTAGPVLRVNDARTLQDAIDLFAAGKGHILTSWPAQLAAITYRYGHLLDVTASKVSQDDVLAPVERDRNPAAARAATYLSGILRWCDNPRRRDERFKGLSDAAVDRTHYEDAGIHETPRERVLTAPEIRAILRPLMTTCPRCGVTISAPCS